MPFLLLHGLDGSGPDHWQTWLAGRLRERGLEVAYPLLPDAGAPHLDAWLAALATELDRLAAPETTVLCHSLGCLLWLHHAGRGGIPVDRALLVAPTQPDFEDPPSVGFRPAPLETAANAARSTRLVCSTDDPYCPPPTSRRIGKQAGVPVDWVGSGGHLNADAGYGPWPALEAWCLGERERVV